MSKDVYIIKSNGEKELFSENKLRNSLERAFASQHEIDHIVARIHDDIEDGMTTDQIYRHAFALLKNFKNPKTMRRYSLRRALIDLGPTGYPFEKYIGELFKNKGYQVALNQMVSGRCVQHEMDIVAYNESKLIMIEAKFHNRLGEKSDLKVALYIKARFEDLIEQNFNYGKYRLLDEGWLITNTKFTENAIQYGECAGLRMIGWNYPAKGSVRDMIEDEKLYPVTCLSNISNVERELLLNNGMVLCRHIIQADSALERLGINKEGIQRITAEANELCGS